MEQTMTKRYGTCLVALGTLFGCDMLGPRASDDPIDAGAGAIDAAIDAGPDAGGPMFVLPPGSELPSIADDAELSNQIRLFDGLDDAALESNGGVVVRAVGKADGATVRYWSFGATPMEGNFAVKAPVYVLATDNGDGTYTPLADHPYLLDSIPGDLRYSALRQITYVPVTARYAGEILPSVEAIAEALALGLVGEPVASGRWRNLPVVPTGTRLEVGGAVEPVAATEVFAHRFRVEVFALGYEQPLRNNQLPVGQASRLLSGVATGDPPTLPTAPDPQPVFQYGVPAGPPADTFNYTPVTTELQVRLASGVAPAAIDDDGDLFTRSGSGSISGYYVDTVASYTVTTTVMNQQIQFAEGSP
jgi:hypothetical protein